MTERLAHVVWIGGEPFAGKTTIARLLAERYGADHYDLDRHLSTDLRDRPGAGPHGWNDLSMDERWLEPTPAEMAERDLSSWTSRFSVARDHLLTLPRSRAIVAEGPAVLPWCVAEVISSPRQAIFLRGTPARRAAVLAARRREGTHFVDRTSDPERAAENLRGRDELMAERVVASCASLGLRILDVDGSRGPDATAAEIAEHFGLRRPAPPGV